MGCLVVIHRNNYIIKPIRQKIPPLLSKQTVLAIGNEALH